MAIATEQLDQILLGKEDEHLECKEAKNHYDFEQLVDYCVALANERGGKMVLGITNERPRKVVGSQAFKDLERTKVGLVERLRLRINAEEIVHPHGRVLVFDVPSRPIGMPLHDKGTYWMRSGESLVPMTADQLKRIFDEAAPDYSAEVCAAASISDLDQGALEFFRSAWRRKSGNAAIDHIPVEQLLSDAELLVGSRLTFAALILMGTRRAVSEHLAQAEVIFEYRSSEGSIPFQARSEYRAGFFCFADELWNQINLRNDIQHFQDGLFIWDVPTVNETVVREAILNAVSHRDYRLGGSVFVRQFPRKLEVVSPGGLAQRLHVDFSADPRFDNPRAVQVRLRNFDLPALIEVGRHVRDLFAEGSDCAGRVRQLADNAYIEKLAVALTGRLGGNVGLAPRLFLKKLVGDILDRIELFPDFDPRRHYALTLAEAEMSIEERQVATVDDIELKL